MFAAHFAAGLAIGAQNRRAPIPALLAAAFLPDLLWIPLAFLGVEPAGPTVFFDGWSHSFLSVFLEACLFAGFFAARGKSVWIAAWLAVMSHLVLDVIVHPAPIALYPHAAIHVPWNLWGWGSVPQAIGFTRYWWLQFCIVLVLLAVYAVPALRRYPHNLVQATILLVLSLHLLF